MFEARRVQHLRDSTPWRAAAAPPKGHVLAGGCAEDLQERDLRRKPDTLQEQPPCKADSTAEGMPGAEQILQGHHQNLELLQAIAISAMHAQQTSMAMTTHGSTVRLRNLKECKLPGSECEGDSHLGGASVSVIPDFVSWACTCLPFNEKSAEPSEARPSSRSEPPDSCQTLAHVT